MGLQPDWRLDLCPADLDGHYAPHSSVAVALAWVELVLAARLDDAWPFTGTLFRLALTRHWCWRNRAQLTADGDDPVVVAAALADDDGPGHPLWAAFAHGQRAPGSPGPGSEVDWVAAGPPEPVGPDLEVVELLPAGVVASGRRAPGLTLILRLGRAGWLVVGHGRHPVRAGWPPCP